MNRHSPIADSLQNTMWDFSRDSGSPHNSSYHAPKIMVADAMSLTPKITEVQEFIDRNKVSLALVTETWLKSAVEDTLLWIFLAFPLYGGTGHPMHTAAFVFISRTITLDLKSLRS